jgi:hypothetical protein
MTPTLRRLNDRERYWGLTWPGWIAAVAAGGVLYGAVKLSPFGFKPTVTIVALLIGLFAMVLLGVSGQALSPGRQMQAIARYRRSPKRWTLPAGADKHGLVLATAPPPDIDEAEGLDLDLERDVDHPWDEDSWGPGDDRRQVRDEDAEGVLE